MQRTLSRRVPQTRGYESSGGVFARKPGGRRGFTSARFPPAQPHTDRPVALMRRLPQLRRRPRQETP
ncbi:hypothetical protein SKAU_G00233490 [Synaphobranchus kaupii]|uniref:Uncharacterized protein n=1 Tax=Synaphobranchus kaupii TaxID=118154 RepID=A0A9Q1F657_SYNKA|nr:hypothetical protein SKAU_G00233490 [Synaphobranchus kaupii]